MGGSVALELRHQRLDRVDDGERIGAAGALDRQPLGPRPLYQAPIRRVLLGIDDLGDIAEMTGAPWR